MGCGARSLAGATFSKGPGFNFFAVLEDLFGPCESQFLKCKLPDICWNSSKTGNLDLQGKFWDHIDSTDLNRISCAVAAAQ